MLIVRNQGSCPHRRPIRSASQRLRIEPNRRIRGARLGGGGRKPQKFEKRLSCGRDRSSYLIETLTISWNADQYISQKLCLYSSRTHVRPGGLLFQRC